MHAHFISTSLALIELFFWQNLARRSISIDFMYICVSAYMYIYICLYMSDIFVEYLAGHDGMHMKVQTMHTYIYMASVNTNTLL